MVLADWNFIDTTGGGILTLLDYNTDILEPQEGSNPPNDTEPCLKLTGSNWKAFPLEGSINGEDVLGLTEGAIDFWVYTRPSLSVGSPFYVLFRVQDIGDLDHLFTNMEGYEVAFNSYTGANGIQIIRRNGAGSPTTLYSGDPGWTSLDTRRWYQVRVQWWVFGGTLYIQVFFDINDGTGFSQKTPVVSDTTNSYAGDETTLGFAKGSSDSFNHAFEGFRVYRRVTE